MEKVKSSAIRRLLTKGIERVIVKKSLEQKLASGKRLRIKLGVDPTSPNLHIGHTVALRKLREFQELKHQIIFLIGDFTARIGDPSDKLSARQPLSDEEIRKNMKTYQKQVGKVLDLSAVEFRYNSEWHKDMDFAELFQLASLFTVNQMLERDMFRARLAKNRPLWVHELLYPILQGYDSVALRSDVELGGTDQTFNLLTARDIQPYYGQVPQDIVTVPLIEGIDGQKKMSKSQGNTIDLLDSPQDMYGKIMSIPDGLIVKYFTLLTDFSDNKIREIRQSLEHGDNPRDHKAALAYELTAMYHGNKQASKAAKEFEEVFRHGKAPDKVPQIKLPAAGDYQLLDIVIFSKLVKSKSEAKRLISQGGVSLEGKVCLDWNKKLPLKKGSLLKIGKRRFVKFV